MNLEILFSSFGIASIIYLAFKVMRKIFNNNILFELNCLDQFQKCYQRKPISKEDLAPFEQKKPKYVIITDFVEHLKFERSYFRDILNDLENEQLKMYASGQIDCLNRLIDKLKTNS